MSTCYQCGQEIEFRYISGRPVPIHPSGGRYCGSWSSPSYPRASSSTSYAGEWHERDYTRPSTCPECGDDVFFIRHNGGCVWVDPPLGWPWPKHGCFDKPNSDTNTFARWISNSTQLTNPRLGLIIRLDETLGSSQLIATVRFPDGARASLAVDPRHFYRPKFLLGSLVLISREDSALILQDTGRNPFSKYTELPPTNSKGTYICQWCKAWVKEGTGHEESCRPRQRTLAKPASPIPNAVNSVGKVSDKKRVAKVAAPSEVESAIDNVACKAWLAVDPLSIDSSRFAAAKQEASHLISKLPPSIISEVFLYFSSQTWMPLMFWEPKHEPSSKPSPLPVPTAASATHPGLKASNPKPEMDPFRRG